MSKLIRRVMEETAQPRTHRLRSGLAAVLDSKELPRAQAQVQFSTHKDRGTDMSDSRKTAPEETRGQNGGHTRRDTIKYLIAGSVAASTAFSSFAIALSLLMSDSSKNFC